MGTLPLHVAYESSCRVTQGCPRDDVVHLAMLQQKFGGLESIRKILADRLLDDALSREADHRARLGQDHVALHGKRCRDAAGSGIGEYGDVRNAVPVQL